MQLQPDQALLLLNTMLPTLEREHQTTVRVFEAIPAGKADYQPDPVAKSAFDLAWHIAASENRFLSGIVAGEFDFSPAPKPGTMPEIVQWYKDSFARNVAAVKKLSGEQLAKIIDFRGMFQLPAVTFLTFTMNHGIHHRGQLSVYLRPMGAKVPAIYGESYDTAEARKAVAKN